MCCQFHGSKIPRSLLCSDLKKLTESRTNLLPCIMQSIRYLLRRPRQPLYLKARVPARSDVDRRIMLGNPGPRVWVGGSTLHMCSVTIHCEERGQIAAGIRAAKMTVVASTGVVLRKPSFFMVLAVAGQLAEAPETAPESGAQTLRRSPHPKFSAEGVPYKVC